MICMSMLAGKQAGFPACTGMTPLTMKPNPLSLFFPVMLWPNRSNESMKLFLNGAGGFREGYKISQLT